MIGHFLDYIRSSYLLWIPPIYKYVRKHPFVWLFFVLLFLMFRGRGLFSRLFLHFFYPDMLPENRTDVPDITAVKDMLHAEGQVGMAAGLIILVLILVWMMNWLRKRYRDPDSLARSIEMTEAERKRTVYVAGLSLYLIITAVWVLPWFCLNWLSDWLFGYGAGLILCILLFSIVFAFVFRGSLYEERRASDESGNGM